MPVFEFVTRGELRSGKDDRSQVYLQPAVARLLDLIASGRDKDAIQAAILEITKDAYRVGFVQGCQAGATDARNYIMEQAINSLHLTDSDILLAAHLLYDKAQDLQKSD